MLFDAVPAHFAQAIQLPRLEGLAPGKTHGMPAGSLL